MRVLAPVIADTAREEFARLTAAKDWQGCRELALTELLKGRDMFWCLSAYGMAEMEAGNTGSALSLFTAAEQLEPGSSDIRCKGAFHNNLAMLYRRLGRLFEARCHYKLAAGYFAQAGLVKWQAAALNNVGCLYTAEGKYEKAVRVLKEAEGVFERLNDLAGLVEVTDSLLKARATAYEAAVRGGE